MQTARPAAEKVAALQRMHDARAFPALTCSASRHAAWIADMLMHGYVSEIIDAPEAGLSIAATVAALWEARAEIARLRGAE
ncbi:MAG TPA: hypothetical protein PLG77_03405 [Burkholderiaceae bacterium]|nr:hypothetical protein [Burkholderiaceae bacterium]